MADPQPDRGKGFAVVLERLLSDQALRHRLGAEGQRQIAGRYDPGAICDTWEALLQSLVRA